MKMGESSYEESNDPPPPPSFSVFSPLIPTLIKYYIPPLYSYVVKPESSTASFFPGSQRNRTTIPRTRNNSLYNADDDSASSSVEDISGGSADDLGSGSSTNTKCSNDNNYKDLDEASIVALPNHEACSGVQWNRVNPALNLLRHANNEAQQPHGDDRLVRTLYINAIGYLLTALPMDLRSDEAATIWWSLPEQVTSSPLSPKSRPDRSIPSSSIGGVHAGTPPARSYVHRLLASSIVCLFLLVQFLMPFVKVALQHLYRYERSWRVAERLGAVLLYIANHVGRDGVYYGTTALHVNDGKVGVAALSLATWWVEGIAGGIYEGVGEGLTILGVVEGPASRLEKNRR